MRERGVTPVEVLFLVATVGIVVGLVVVTVRGAGGDGDHAACAQNLRTLGKAIVQYAEDHDQLGPPATTAEEPAGESSSVTLAQIKASPAVFSHALATYVKSKSVWFCPADAQRGRDTLSLGQRHLLTSYSYLPPALRTKDWPPRLSLAKGGNASQILLSDAMGDSGARKALSNHPDGKVNAIRSDLSLIRSLASEWPHVSN